MCLFQTFEILDAIWKIFGDSDHGLKISTIKILSYSSIPIFMHVLGGLLAAS